MTRWKIDDQKLEKIIKRNIDKVLNISPADAELTAEFGKRWGGPTKRVIKIRPLSGRISIDINTPKRYDYIGFAIENMTPKGFSLYYHKNKFEIAYCPPRKS